MLQIGALALGMLSALAATIPAASAGVVWSADRAHSRLTLAVSQLLIAKVRGTIPIASGKIVTREGKGIPLHVDVALDAGSLTTGDSSRDADLRSDKFFDVARYPTITFASDRIVGTDPAAFAVVGELTMRGVTHPITFQTHVAGMLAEPNGRRRIRYEAAGTFRRSDYGMVYARGIVGNKVTLNVVIDAVNGPGGKSQESRLGPPKHAAPKDGEHGVRTETTRLPSACRGDRYGTVAGRCAASRAERGAFPPRAPLRFVRARGAARHAALQEQGEQSARHVGPIDERALFPRRPNGQ